MTEQNIKKETVNGVEYGYSSEWIYSLEHETHWRLYWRQQKIMHGKVQPDQHVLEIGVGSGFTANYLRSKEVEVTTLDIDQDKDPDIVANIVTYDFPEKYDHILAFQVFEHIPYSEFERLLPRLRKACREHLIMSVPQNEIPWFRIELHLPKAGTFSFQFATRKGSRLMTPAHHWELGLGDSDMNRLERSLKQAGFQILEKEKAFSRWFFVIQ